MDTATPLVDSLAEFAKQGAAAQAAVDSLLKIIRVCPYCGRRFLPQAHNQKYCRYQCRWDTAAEIRHMKRNRGKP